MLIATMISDSSIPATCWIAPEIPIAKYTLGRTVFPVCPTWISLGCHPLSTTAREQLTYFPYKVYKVFNTKKESLYLIEVDRSYHKEYDFLFVKGENYVFYQINNSFIPIMYVLKSFFKRNNETLLKSIECLSLAWLYYHAN